LNVLFDHQIFSTQVYGGASNYFFELMKRLDRHKDIDVSLSLLISNNAYVKSLNCSRSIAIPHSLQSGKMTRTLLAVNGAYSRHLIRKREFDVFHPTYYDPYFLDDLKSKPFVVTVFDMIHEIYPQMFNYDGMLTARKASLVRRAAAIIAISESTKTDIMKHYGIAEEKIKVIHLATSFSLPERLSLPHVLPDRYLLFVGHRTIYKNFVPFIRAITPILKSDLDLTIVCAGGGPLTKSEQSLFTELGIGTRVVHYAPSNDVMILLYAKAISFVFPTLYEGFGLPVLEAFSCRCPATISNTTSLREVASDAALYFDPSNETSMREAIAKIIYDGGLRQELIQLGIQRLKEFSWEKSAALTRDVYLTTCA